MFPRKFVAAAFIIAGVCLSFSEAATKTWSSNTNFDNSENWDVLRKPCEGDRVFFPKNLRGAVLIGKAAIGKEMVLPNDGQLILGENLDLSFGNKDDSCDAQDVLFIKTEWKNWFDTENWSTSDYQPDGERPIPNPVPHSDRIPCTDDDVVFPRKSSFRVTFGSRYASVRSMSVSGKKYTTSGFKSFISSDVGSAQFQINGDIQVTGSACTDPSGCSCQDDRTESLAAICSAVGLKCESPKCDQAIKPLGHCCRMCGSYVVMTYSSGFKISRVQEVAKTFLNKETYKNCRGYLSKIKTGKIQFVITDKGDGSSTSLAKEFTSHLGTDIDNSGIYNLESVERYSSGKESPEDDTSSNKKHSVVGKIVGIFFGIIIFIVVVVLAVFMYRKTKNSDFSFVRFSSDKIEMELGTTPHSDLDPGAISPMQHAFNNPMYNLPVVEIPAETREKAKLTKKSKVEFENPMYMEYEEGQDD